MITNEHRQIVAGQQFTLAHQVAQLRRMRVLLAKVAHEAAHVDVLTGERGCLSEATTKAVIALAAEMAPALPKDWEARR